MAEMRKTYKVSIGKLEGMNPVGRHRRRCNIKIDFKEVSVM
jgi:hypothetical protein